MAEDLAARCVGHIRPCDNHWSENLDEIQKLATRLAIGMWFPPLYIFPCEFAFRIEERNRSIADD